jgi:hypothetical protein
VGRGQSVANEPRGGKRRGAVAHRCCPRFDRRRPPRAGRSRASFRAR